MDTLGSAGTLPQRVLRADVYIGWQFGAWTVTALPHTGGKQGKTYVPCECKCGTQRDVLLASLNRQRAGELSGSVSCGCLRRDGTRTRNTIASIYIGQKFTRWTVVKLPFKIDGRGHYRVGVLCECGNPGTVSVPNLFDRESMSCGCLSKESKISRRHMQGSNQGKLCRFEGCTTHGNRDGFTDGYCITHWAIIHDLWVHGASGQAGYLRHFLVLHESPVTCVPCLAANAEYQRNARWAREAKTIVL